MLLLLLPASDAGCHQKTKKVLRNIYHSTAEWIIGKMILSGIIMDADSAIYLHGVEMGLAMLTWALTLAALGLLVGMPLEAGILLLVLMTLRSYAGGFHASSHLACYLLSSACIVFILPVRFTPQAWQTPMGIIILVITLLIIWRFAPVATRNREYDEAEIGHYHKRACIVAGCEATGAVVFLLFGRVEVFYTICLSMFAVTSGMLVGMISNHKNAGRGAGSKSDVRA